MHLDRHAGIALQVLPLRPRSRGVEENMLPVVVDPDGGHVRGPVLSNRRRRAEVLVEKELRLLLAELSHVS
jgi:hypothetical protein